jgi:hypothetical protein
MVLDPFSGAGTTVIVAQELGRKYIGIALHPVYIFTTDAYVRLNMRELSDCQRF